MQSKTSYFNKTLFRKNLTRFWPLWGGASLAGALAPAAMFVAMVQYGRGSVFQTPLEMTRAYYSVVSWAVPIISLVYAALCAMAVWSYLYNARSVSMFHTLPVTRKGLFVTNLLSGLAMMLIPYVIVGTLTILVTLVGKCFEPVGLLMTILYVLGLSFFYFASATIVAFITGNVFAMPALYFIFHFLAAALEWLISTLMTQFYYGVHQAYEGIVEWLSPTIYLCENLYPYGEYEEIVDLSGRITHEVTQVHLERSWLIAVYALVGVALLACAYLLYQRRRSECAGDVVAVNWMKPIFRYGVALCAALTGGMAIYSIVWSGFQSRETADLLPMALSMAFAGLIGYYIASMLLAKSLRVFRSTWKGAAATVIAAAALCLTVGLDPIGVETWTPADTAVEQVWFSLDGPGGYSAASGTVGNPEAIRQLVSLHQTIVAERNSLQRYGSRSTMRTGYPERDSYQYAWARLEYLMKNGKRVVRSYSLRFPQSDIQREGSAPCQMSRLMTEPAIQEVNIFGGVDEQASLTGGSLEANHPKTGERLNWVLTAEEAQILESAVRRDIEQGHFGKTAFMVDGSTNQTVYRNEIQLYYVRPTLLENEENYSRPVNSYVNLHISTYCTETVKALQSLNGYGEDWCILTYEEIDALSEAYNSSDYYEDYYYDMPAGAVEVPDTEVIRVA